jgi:hypothetical protein
LFFSEQPAADPLIPNKQNKITRFLAVWGCISTGLVYTGIGIVAILSFLKLKQGGADEGSLLKYFDRFIAGRVLIWLILLGMISFVAWRIYESIKDPYGYGNGWKAVLKRTAIGLSSLADALIALSAIQVLTGTGGLLEPVNQRL